MKKIVLYLLLIMFLLMIPLAGTLSIIYTGPDLYEESYSRVFEDQFNYLKEAKGEKIVIVGTSSAAFGIIAEEMEKEFNKPVVVFGLYGAMGNTYLLDLAIDYIKEGDIVLYMYDIYETGMTVGFSPEIFLQATYGNYDAYSKLSIKYKCQVLANLPSYINENYQDAKKNRKDFGIFSREAFNEHGTIQLISERNEMKGYFELESSSDISSKIIDTELTDYVSSWANTIRKKGATVYYHYGPVDNLARTENTTSDKVLEFEEAWEKAIGMTAINEMLDCYIDYRYFYNGNFHLNYYGAQYFTSYMIRNIEKAIYGYSNYEIVYPDYPTPLY